MFRFPDDILKNPIENTGNTLRDAENPERDALWKHLNYEVKSHQNFGDTDWILRGERLDKLAEIASEFTPQDPVLQVMELFDDFWNLDDGDQQKLRRNEAIANLATEGTKKIIELLVGVRSTNHVLQGLIDAGLSTDFLDQLIRDSFSDEIGSDCTASLLRIFRDIVGDKSSIALVEKLHEPSINDTQISRLLCVFPSEPPLWDAVSKFGEAVEELYWQNIQPIWTEAERPTLIRLMVQLARRGWSIAALEAGRNRLKEVPSCLLLVLLKRSVLEINNMSSGNTPLNLAYRVDKVFEELDRRGLPDTYIAPREYGLLPLIERSKRPLRLHRLMASDAEICHEIIRQGYRAETVSQDVDDAELPDGKRANWRHSYKLLRGFSIVPGFEDTEPSARKLTDWIDHMQRLAVEHDRTVRTNFTIGHVLAHSRHDDLDGGWPHRFVRDQIERLSNADVELGLQRERSNMRGVTVRAPRDGGTLERELAADYRNWASIAERWPRTTSLLAFIAESWEKYAKRVDSKVRQRDLRDTI